MSAQVQVQTIGRSFKAGSVVVVLLALAIGAGATVAIDAIVTGSGRVETATPTTLWDSGKLEAIGGRQLAETVTFPMTWDAQMLDAIEGRQLAETVRLPVLWDTGKIEAMQGRQQAEMPEPVVYDSWMGEAFSGTSAQQR